MTQPASSGPARADAVSRLSKREREVLQMASLGLTNAEIAGDLGVSIHAVKFHLAGVYRKLHVHNRTEAVARLLTAQLSPPRAP